MDKASVRRLVRQRREALLYGELMARSGILARTFLESVAYRRASTLYVYLSIAGEVQTTPIIEQALWDGKLVAAPRVTDGRLRFFLLDRKTRIEPGYQGIPEPVDGEEIRDGTALVLTPGVAFTVSGHRIGYGGGFYDRFFAAEPDHPTTALCFGFQIFPQLPTDPHDITVDQVIWDHPEVTLWN